MVAIPYQKHLFTKRWRQVRPPPINEFAALLMPLVSILKRVLKPDILMRHYPAGERRDERTGAKLKAMATMAGCADLEFIWRDIDGELHILFIELKLPKRKLSPAQAAFRDRVIRLGPYCVATTIDEALAALKQNDLLRSRVAIDVTTRITEEPAKRTVGEK